MKTVWKVQETNTRLQKVLCEALSITPFFAQLLVNREIKTPEEAHEFLFGGLASCHDPFKMKDMEKAVTRIKKAIVNKEKILIYGDYDVDGVTSTAMLAYTLEALGADHGTFIPNRLEDGYGMNIRAVAKAREDGVGLIVTVDCGINSVDQIKCANDYGIDVIITDHHEVKDAERPQAYAIIDPHQEDCRYPYQFLAGVGVVYKLARALMIGHEQEVDENLDLVALGTIADVAPQSGENRVLTKLGLKALRDTKKEGLKALMDISGVDPDKMSCRDIGFRLAPRINAMGRVGSANIALELLLTKDALKAKEMAKRLDEENKNRQKIEREILKSAISKVESEIDLENDKMIVLADDEWHPGVIGIVASRLTEQYGLPAILICLDGDKGKGSGRAVEGFNLFDAVLKAEDHLIDFGGHEGACGVKISRDKVEDFTSAVNEAAKDVEARSEEALAELNIDLSLPFAHVDVRLIKELEMLMPYGPGNAEPVFATKGIKVKNSPHDIKSRATQKSIGFKFFATCGSLTCQAITFKKNQITRPKQGDIIDLAYTPSINSWNGFDSVQLNIRDLQVVG